MSNSEVQAHSAGGDEDDAPCGIQSVGGFKPDGDVVAHSAADEEDEAACLIQNVSG
jgi:hypothetical protein